ncbi:MAG TPA: T9SS type A sorting domain-containing protein [Rhodothermales bacterium]
MQIPRIVVRLIACAATLVLAFTSEPARAQTVTVEASTRYQVIDGFGAHQSGSMIDQAWWQQLFFDDLRASIFRIDMTPRFVSPYSDLNYYSPWFMGSATNSVFNLEDPDNPNGPENNRVRTYTSATDYGRDFGGRQAPIAVMGPDIEQNIQLLDVDRNGAVQAGLARIEQLGDFKLVGSLWSPAPWVKISSGNSYNQDWWPGPVAGTPWPFVWGGNFAGGRLDVSNQPLAVFDDSHLGGTGPTSALVQFARTMAAYLRAFQRENDVKFYAISIQNELNFEQYYNSCTYPLSSQYITALKAIRAELDKYPDLQDIRIMGPEDLLGGDAYGMWQYGGSQNPTHKNLQYLQNIAADAEAAEAVDFFCIHGYDADGVTSSGADPTLWNWWVNGWNASPAAGIPSNVRGFASYGKKSWMTETSGEAAAWLVPATGFPSRGAFSVAMRIHQALTAGMESAWIYWTFADGDDAVSEFGLTNQAAGANSPKYVAAKHFFRYIRPNAVRVEAATDVESIWSSAYVHDVDGSLTVVLLNTEPTATDVTVRVPSTPTGITSFDTFTSSNGSYWQSGNAAVDNGETSVTVPGYGVVTLFGQGVPGSGLPGGGNSLIPTFEAFPNPAAGSAQIVYAISQPSRVVLRVYDALGREVETLVNASQAPGRYEIEHVAAATAPGVYFYHLTAGNVHETRRVAILR